MSIIQEFNTDTNLEEPYRDYNHRVLLEAWTNGSKNIGDDEYLVAKGIVPNSKSLLVEHGFRVIAQVTLLTEDRKSYKLKSFLLYPLCAYNHNGIAAFQTISNDGKDKLIFGSVGKPLYSVFGNIDFDSSNHLITVESPLKALALYESLAHYGDTNISIVNAVNAGNQAKLIAYLFERGYKHQIAGCDNDKGKKSAPILGINKMVYEVLIDTGVRYFMPPDELPDDANDFDDWYKINDFAASEIEDAYIDAKPINKPKVSNNLESFKERLTKDIKSPNGFTLGVNGLRFETSEKDETTYKSITSKPVWVEAISRDQSKESYGKLVCWFDFDDNFHQIAIPNRLFFAQGNEIAQLLADGGLPITYGMQKKLLEYLTSVSTKNRLVAASATGWFDNSFVLPTHTINEPTNEKIVFQPSGLSNIAKAIHSKGDIESYRNGIKDAPEVMIFGICAGLAAPIRYPLNHESGGFHLCGLSSKGKTTVLQGVASVWGCGSDPAMAGGQSVYIQRFNSTDNALEGKAELYNDLPMVLDEIGESDSKEFGKTIYRLMSGQGKSRANRNGDLRDSKSWRTMVFSAGELGVAEYIESNGGTAKGGQIVRMPDIPVDKIFEDADEANHYKSLFTNHYGLIGKEFISKCTDLKQGWSELNGELIGDAKTNTSKRVRDRFLLVAHAGILAVKNKILPWTEEQVIDAVKYCYELWHSQSGGVSESDRGITNINDFILSYGNSRFEYDNNLPIDRAGWSKDGVYYFTLKAFKEACAGTNVTEVKKQLKFIGMLKINKPPYSCNYRDGKSVISTVAVNSMLLNYCSNTGNTDNNVDK